MVYVWRFAAVCRAGSIPAWCRLSETCNVYLLSTLVYCFTVVHGQGTSSSRVSFHWVHGRTEMAVCRIRKVPIAEMAVGLYASKGWDGTWLILVFRLDIKLWICTFTSYLYNYLVIDDFLSLPYSLLISLAKCDHWNNIMVWSQFSERLCFLVVRCFRLIY